MAGAGGTAPVLVVNAGSSSIRFAVFDRDLRQRLAGIAEGIGGSGARLHVGGTRQRAALADHGQALAAILEALAAQGLPLTGFAAAAHRVVHGGQTLTEPVRILPETLQRIAACTPLAPLHNPHNLAAIETLAGLAPALPQFASFDTAFHATMPEVARRYALPETEATGEIRRYGFHGLSYSSVVDALPALSGAPLPRRLLALHLGNGASLCAIEGGRSVATTMGYSPLEGLTMGTRAGGIDANAVLRLVGEIGAERTGDLLNNESGLRGLSGGIPDMRALLADPAPAAQFAVAHFCYWAVRHAGAMIAAMGGLDAVAFSGGIGENAAPVRARILDGLGWLGLRPDAAANAAGGPRLHGRESRVGCWIVPAQEERVIAADALRLMQAGG